MARVLLVIRLLMVVAWVGGMVVFAVWVDGYFVQLAAEPYKTKPLFPGQDALSVTHVGYWMVACTVFSPAVFLTLLHWALRPRG